MWLQIVWVQVPSDTPIYWYSIMVSAGVLYTQDEGSSPYTSTILEYLSGLRAQTANLMIRGFKSHLQVL
nr:MAG TPA: hypothetical protein [Crassvirales sp.]